MPLPTMPLMPMPTASRSESSLRAPFLEGDVSMLALRHVLPLVAQHRERPAELWPRLLGQDHLVDVSQLRGLVRVGEGVAIFLHQLLTPCLSGFLHLLAEDDVHR